MQELEPPVPDDLLTWLLNDLVERLASALESMTGERPAISWKPLAPSSGLQPNFWWEQPLTLPRNAEFWVGAMDDTWRAVGDFVLRAAGVENPEPTDARSTYLEILSQAFSGLAQSLGARVGREVGCLTGHEIAAPPPGVAMFAVEVALPPHPVLALWFGIATQLLEAVKKLSRPAEPGEPDVPRAPAPGEPAPPESPQSAFKQNPKTLELLLEVELPVSISFGRTQLPLRDVLKLTTGSIVELNRTVSEPVEVIVNNCVIARGEVVVIDGNYGVRIHEIISRGERLRSLA